MYITMLLRLIVMVLIAVALLSTASCMFDPNTSGEGCCLGTPKGKLAVVAVIILAAGQNLIYGLAIAILFVMFTNNDYREGLTGKGASDIWCQNMVKTYGEATMSRSTYPSDFGVDAPEGTLPNPLWGADAQKMWKDRCGAMREAAAADKAARKERAAEDALVTLDKTALLEQPALKTAYNKMVCDPAWSTAGGTVTAEQAAARRTLLSSMTANMTMEFPYGPCNPCSANNDCRYHITKGGDQLQAAQDIVPMSTRGTQ